MIELSGLTIGLIGMGILILLIALRVPIAFALALVGVTGTYLIRGGQATLAMLGSIPFTVVNTFTYIMIPLFIFMGHLAALSGLTERLFRVANAWLGHLPGGLVIAALGGAGGFAACSGSSLATAVTIGKITLPEMERYGYDRKLAAGCVAAGGTVGSMIPPSLLIVFLGIITEQSIGKLLMAGVIPGVMEIILYMSMVSVRATVNPRIAPRVRGFTWKTRLSLLPSAWGAVLLAFTVIGGIYLGVFTPTEAAAVGSVVAFIMVLVARRFTVQGMKEALAPTIGLSCMIFLILIGANFFATFLALCGLPQALADLIEASHLTVLGFGVAVFSLYFILGTFMDPVGIMVLTMPVLFPAVLSVGMNPIWFGIFCIRMFEIALITPPFGINVFAIAGIAKNLEMSEVFRGIIPFLIMDVIHCALLIAFPAIVLWLPNTMMGT